MQTPCSLLAGLCVNVSRLVPKYTATAWENLPANPVTFLTLHSAVCHLPEAGLEWLAPARVTQALGVTVTSTEVILQMQREYTFQIPVDSLWKLDRGGGDDDKCTLSNFSLSIIWKDSSQSVIIPVLLHCFPPAEPITPGRLSGIQGPSRKDSLDFWFSAELGSTCTNAVREELIMNGGWGQSEVEKEIQFVFDSSVKHALTFMQIRNMELNITNYRLWVFVSFIIVITINAMISNLRGHCVCLIYFLRKLSISFPSEDLFVGLLVACPHWHRLGPPLGIWELLAGSLSNHNQAWFSLHSLVNQGVSLPSGGDTMQRF